MRAEDWKALADAYAFVGNSLLRPMTQTADVGLDAEAAAAEGDLARELSGEEVAAFIDAHPLGWIEALEEKVEAAYTEGYFVHLLTLVRALLTHHRSQLG